MRASTKLLLAVWMAVVGIAGGANTASAQSGQPIRLGFTAELTGPLAINGKQMLVALEIWRDNLNAHGGLLGRPVELVYYDDQSNTALVPGIYTKPVSYTHLDVYKRQVDQGEHTERYQGIVALEGASLSECVHHYFRQSEQVEAGLKVAVARVKDAAGSECWRAGALMIERLPTAGGVEARESEDEGWRHAMILMSTSTSAELLDAALRPEQLLFRLFHEEGVHDYKPHELAARCRCSRERVETCLLYTSRCV